MNRFPKGRYSKAVDRLSKDIMILQWIAVLQQTLERELGHLQFHTDRVNDNSSNKKYLELEKDVSKAGSAFQVKLQRGHVPEKVASKHSHATLVELTSEHSETQVFTQRAFIKVDHYPSNSEEGTGKLDPEEEYQDPLNIEELLSLMEYPKQSCIGSNGGNGDKKRKRDVPGDTSGPSDTELSNDGHEGKGADHGDYAGSHRRNPRPWQESVRHYLLNAARISQKFRVRAGSSHMGANKFESKEFHRHASVRKTKETIAAFRECKFDFKFCDSSKQERSCFTQEEDVCVIVTITNTTKNPVVVYMTAGQFFGRSGFVVGIENIERGRITSYPAHELLLEPEEDITAFRTITQPPLACGAKRCDVAYITPPVGNYRAFASIMGKRLDNVPTVPFTIVASRADVEALTWYDEFQSKQFQVRSGVKRTEETVAEFRKCAFDIKFCDSSKKERSCFRQNEDICVIVTVTNTTASHVVVYMTPGQFFSRSGFRVDIEGMERGRVTPAPFHQLILQPGEQVTVFRTMTQPPLASGAKPCDVPYVTPPVGKYRAFASIMGKRLENLPIIPFSIVASKDEIETTT